MLFGARISEECVWTSLTVNYGKPNVWESSFHSSGHLKGRPPPVLAWLSYNRSRALIAPLMIQWYDKIGCQEVMGVLRASYEEAAVVSFRQLELPKAVYRTHWTHLAHWTNCVFVAVTIVFIKIIITYLVVGFLWLIKIYKIRTVGKISSLSFLVHNKKNQ